MSLEDIKRRAEEVARNAQENLNNAENAVNTQIDEARSFIQAGGVDTTSMNIQFENNTFNLTGTVETGEQFAKLNEVVTTSGSESTIINNVQLEDFTAKNVLLKVKTKGSNLNVRGGAGTENEIVGKFANGSEVQLVQKIQSDWYRVRNAEVEGFCHTNFLVTPEA